MSNDDYSVIQRCLSGERNAFRFLVERYQKPVFDTAVRMLFDPEIARDIAQETFVKAYTKLHTFNPSYPFRVWIQRIATHCAIDYLRRKKPEYLILDDTTNPERPVMKDQIKSSRIDPQENLEKMEASKLVREAVYKLDPKLRVVIVLRHFRDMNYDEIADALKIPLGTVKNRLFRAREKLQEILLAESWAHEEVAL